MKPVARETIQHIVQTPAAEFRPAWSPDGRDIAFARAGSATESGIFIVSRVGGVARRVSDTGTTVAWFPDGKSLLIRDRVKDEPYGIFRLDLDTLQARRLTRPLVGEGDWSFDVSPDGKTVAFIRSERPGVSDLYVMPAVGGEPKRVTEWNSNLAGPAWTPDGKELIYATANRLWRVAPGTGRNAAISETPLPAGHVSVSRPGDGQPVRLAFQTRSERISLRLVDLDTAGVAGTFQSVAPFAPATRRDAPGRFSPDGSRVAFTSTRASSDYELWVADTDGRNVRQVTTMRENRGMLAHSWSPDGTKILFDSALGGNNDVYLISANGGNALRLTTSAAIEGLAEWSGDGRWIYYTNVTNARVSHIWRIPASGGIPEQVTKENASEPQISPDGKYLYYLDRPPIGHSVSARLMRMPAAGGQAQPVCEGLTPSYWSVTDKGVYFLVEEASVHSIHLYRFPDGQMERVGTLPFRVTNVQGPGRLTVSRDGRWALVNVTDRTESDLMLLENFR